ncbi:MAG: DUF2249 domain-containing protein [Rhodanobacter sp.]
MSIVVAHRTLKPVAEIDLRALPMPEPLERALAASDALAPGESLTVLTPWMPAPLLQALAERGMQVGVETLPPNGARVWIRKPTDDQASA